jgi:hypothetical protein
MGTAGIEAYTTTALRHHRQPFILFMSNIFFVRIGPQPNGCLDSQSIKTQHRLIPQLEV